MIGPTPSWPLISAVTPTRTLRMLPVRAPLAEAVPSAPAVPGLPTGALVSVAWRLDGAGEVVGALLPPGHPAGGPLGARVLAGAGVWPATMWPAGQGISRESSLIELAPEPARLVVCAADQEITGMADQPGRPRSVSPWAGAPSVAGPSVAGPSVVGRSGVGRSVVGPRAHGPWAADPRTVGRRLGPCLRGLVAGLRRDNRQVRIRVADRVWWLRASGMFGVRVTRGGQQIYLTRGMVGHFCAVADELDISVVLLTLSAIPSSTYAPLLGF